MLRIWLFVYFQSGDLLITGKQQCYRSLRTVLTTFAAENNVLDLRIAYRLILAECPEKLAAA